MKNTNSIFVRLLLIALSFFFTGSACAVAAPLTWTAAYDQPNATTTRSLRGVAVNDDATAMYGTFLQGSSTASVRSFSLAGSPPVGTQTGNVNISGFIGSSGAINTQAEAAVTDDRGFAFTAIIKESTSDSNSKIAVFSADLGTNVLLPLAKITVDVASETIGGVDFRMDGLTRQLYVSRFRNNTAYVERYVIGGTDVASTTLTLDTSFAGTGRLDLQSSLLPTANNLRGIDVADDGTIFIASRENNALYKIAPNLLAASTVAIPNAMDVALFNGAAYVTQYAGTSSGIQVIDMNSLSLLDSITATGAFARGGDGGYAGIDISSTGRIFLVDQFYAGTSSNLSDRILVSSIVPEPTSVTLALTAVAGLWRLRRKRS